MDVNDLDKQHVWHPFTHLNYAEAPIEIIKAEGSYFYDNHGNKIIDAISSWWVNLHGHCHPYISEKVSKQLFQFEHAIFSGFTHRPAVELAHRLLKHLPSNQSKIFYSDNGSTAVEVALKMVLQYWHNQGIPKTTFIAFENAYHGDTFGGMSVGARNVFNQAFSPLLFDVVHIPVPNQTNIEQVKNLLQQYLQNKSVCGFVFEPLIQGAGGMVMYEPNHLDELISICKQNNILTIADEVMTGFGRTGRFFASDYLTNKPDVFCLSKGLTGGYMPLGVTSCSEIIYQAYLTDDKTKTFFHGHSYTANPTACSASLASLDLMEQEDTWTRIQTITSQHEKFAITIKNQKAIKDVRMLGTIIAIELNTEESTNYLNTASEKISAYFINKHILLRPLGNILYLIPPYCISEDDLNYVYQHIDAFLTTL